MIDYTNHAEALKSFRKLLDILVTLRAPEGCPWDRKQTSSSLKNSLIEESYETIDAITSDKPAHIREELGDLFLLVSMISLIEEESGRFTVSEVLEEVSDKLIRRHPHVFGDVKLSSSDEVLTQWKQIKEDVEGREKKDSVLDEVSKALPPLERAFKLQKKAAGAGFDWTGIDDVWAKVLEEIGELQDARTSGNEAHIEEEIGDLLFSVVNITRFLGVDPAVALHRTNEKFSRRFRSVEKKMAERGLPMSADTFSVMDTLWDAEKDSEKS